jgi:predicted nucleotidyltransferase
MAKGKTSLFFTCAPFIFSPEQMTAMSKKPESCKKIQQPIDLLHKEVLTQFPQLCLAIVFGSVAFGRQRPDSDLDIAIAANHPLPANEKMTIIRVLAERIGRPIDLIDLGVVAEPLLGQVVRHGRRILGSDTRYGELIRRHLFEQADFMPYRNRILAERRQAWIGK